MNRRACSHEAYTPTFVEHMANVITHGIWIIPSLVAALELLQRSMSWTQFVSATIYGTSLLLVFTVSTFFHCVHYHKHNGQLKDALHRFDRAMIYIFIAATYFPWLNNERFQSHVSLSTMRILIWIMASLGILYQQIFHERYKKLETIFYLVMGVGPSIAIVDITEYNDIVELKLGGLMYILGIIFFKADGRIPCAHAIWHIFVVSGAAFHYFAILHHLYPIAEDEKGSTSITNSLLSNFMESHLEL
ncbi:monocyte to macrophage differentiation factor 2 isoform X2 [Belonocnema kinseyi]|nr:monocyte to macrophage differentiation factor 2 isoform X2 [Belonocnema kinseyi]XP_033213116.1 monocyte to macrophage differentiation factor 2 isoform X2 [Belonocnema kinseyi]XP_033213117.1 monocyte to macrophage differentiation factor 2 isoform X2 [Belonocnema kinseyi]